MHELLRLGELKSAAGRFQIFLEKLHAPQQGTRTRARLVGGCLHLRLLGGGGRRGAARDYRPYNMHDPKKVALRRWKGFRAQDRSLRSRRQALPRRRRQFLQSNLISVKGRSTSRGFNVLVRCHCRTSDGEYAACGDNVNIVNLDNIGNEPLWRRQREYSPLYQGQPNVYTCVYKRE